MNRLGMRRLASVVAMCFQLAAASLAWAGPGAHGPNGEHLDAPSSGQAQPESTPRMEAKSEDFELVARLSGGELTMMINRFATGEPVLGAKVEVESGPRKVVLPFHEDVGSYATSDASLLKVLAMPGTHPLVITIVAGAESDLLDGVLNVTVQAAQAFEAGGQAPDHAHAESHGSSWSEWMHKPITWILGIAALAAAAWGGVQWRRRRGLFDPRTSGAM